MDTPRGNFAKAMLDREFWVCLGKKMGWVKHANILGEEVKNKSESSSTEAMKEVRNEEDYLSSTPKEKFEFMRDKTVKITENFFDENKKYLLDLVQKGNLLRVPLFVAYISPFKEERNEKREDEGGSLGIKANMAYLLRPDIQEILRENLFSFLFLGKKDLEKNKNPKDWIAVDKDITSSGTTSSYERESKEDSQP